MKNLFWSASTSNKTSCETLFQVIRQEHLWTLMTLKKWFFSFLLRFFSDSEKSLLCKGFRFALPPEETNYADFLAHTLEFNLLSEKRDFVKNKPKDIFSSTLNSYNFNKVNTNLTELECKYLKELIQHKDLVIHNADKDNKLLITNHENYLKSMKLLLSDNSKFI